MQTMFLLDIGKHDVILSVSILIRKHFDISSEWQS